MKKNSALKFAAGVGVGVGLGVLFAPKSGAETRKDLKKKLDELSNKIKEIDTEDLKNQFFNKVEDIKNELDDLDKEKVLAIAKEKGEELKKQAEELLTLAKEKGTPVLEKTAEEVRQKTIAVVKDVLNRLENPSQKA